MSRIVIVGAGGFGREIFAWLRSSPKFLEREKIDSIVYIDDRDHVSGLPAPCIGTIEEYVPSGNDKLICAIGSPEARQQVVEKIEARSGVFVQFLHDLALVGINVVADAGLVVCPNVVISSDIRIGRHVHINSNCTIGHDVVISDFATLSSSCNLTGAVEVGESAFLGTAVTVIPGKTIGAGALVGAGSVVLRDVPPGVTSFGNPSKSYGLRNV
ncbi:acetyltransferase [Cryobacterium levicorallinum]|uniref:Acetyltransferase n=1 Tax=Cryobacterium levicorallinum TaxID=995038 RepID=A0A1I3E095_9MICO|nr:acetyltransferase [Cryobacterium levicorallinum]TFB81519.1 acetyltransferase [Cryobacterium levicorallinum]GEP28564.1 transferase [Cryobacterium levicorallinum]SFH92397.1 sugar O-acyltransferase, sialic acid O-acetyltransferase NeuD family [Cryobacterium levicorallinum]